MNSKKSRSFRRNLFSVRSLEKASYAALVPAVFLYFGYRLYKQNVVEVEQRALELKQMEDQFLKQAHDNLA